MLYTDLVNIVDILFCYSVAVNRDVAGPESPNVMDTTPENESATSRDQISAGHPRAIIVPDSPGRDAARGRAC